MPKDRNIDSEAKARGHLIANLRFKFAPNVKLATLAEYAEIDDSDTIWRWERGHTVPEFKTFWKYLKVLKREAAAQGELSSFEHELDRVVRALYPVLYEEYVTSRTAGDDRTPEEYAQDRYDSSRDPETSRDGELKTVPNMVSPLQMGDPKSVMTRDKIEGDESWRALPDKAFEVGLVFPIEKPTIYIHRSGIGVSRTPYLLTIDMRDQKYAIYNEAGKRRLRDLFGGSEVLKDASTDIHTFLMRISEKSDDRYWRSLTKGRLLPLRWASGGVLPVVRCLRPGPHPGDWESDGDWVALFFRDIPPVGLNVGNGASENRNEAHNLKDLIGREFAEELVLVNKRPQRGEVVEQEFFRDVEGGRALSETNMFRDFVVRHNRLRKEHDGVDFLEADVPRFLTPLQTPFGVRVIDSPAASSGGGRPAEHITRCRNVILSVNPSELGIEVIRPYKFELKRGEWLMDGEILPSSRSEYPYLVRRPIILIRLGFLREQFHKNRGSLGEISEDPDSLGGKCLPPIPADSYRVFAEMDLRKARLSAVENALRSSDEPRKHSLENEKKHITRWLERYGDIFAEAEAGEKSLTAEAVRTLCPVSYKTIELMLNHVLGF